MTINDNDQERYDRLSALEEQPTGTSTPGVSHTGADAAAIGRQLLLDALGSEAAVTRAIRGGRPNLAGKSGAGEASPQIRVRVTAARKQQLEELKRQMHRNNTSDVVREAIDEYVSKHLKASA